MYTIRTFLTSNALSLLTPSEIDLIEADFFVRTCEELKSFFRHQYKNFLQVLNYNYEMEDAFVENNFITDLVKDILDSEEYTLPGIAYHTQISEDALLDLILGRNLNPSLRIFRKIVELHRTSRPEFYRLMAKKIIIQDMMK